MAERAEPDGALVQLDSSALLVTLQRVCGTIASPIAAEAVFCTRGRCHARVQEMNGDAGQRSDDRRVFDLTPGIDATLGQGFKPQTGLDCVVGARRCAFVHAKAMRRRSKT